MVAAITAAADVVAGQRTDTGADGGSAKASCGNASDGSAAECADYGAIASTGSIRARNKGGG